MTILNKIYHYINILSVDVVAGSVASALFFAKVFKVSVSINTLAALAISVWAIYTVDHLIDARSVSGIASTDRHRFHQKNFILLLCIVPAVIFMGAYLMRFVPYEVSSIGFVLGLVVIAYLISQQHLKFLKEILVAILYTGGVVLPSMVAPDLNVQPLHYVIIVQFFFTALLNLLLFSFFDYHHDLQHKQSSFAILWGRDTTLKSIVTLGSLNVLISFWFLTHIQSVAIMFLLMNGILLTIILFEKDFRQNNYYRIAGDAIFILPVFSLL